MFRFFKENKSIILKCFLNQIGMMVFGLIVLITAKMINVVLFHALGIVAIITYMFLLYTIMWERGAEDKIKIDSGRITENKFYGLFVSLWANSINILLAVLVALTSFFISSEKQLFVNNIHAVCKIIVHYTNAMYLSITTISNITPFIYIIIIIPSLLVCFGSYILGIKGYNHIMPEKKRKNK